MKTEEKEEISLSIDDNEILNISEIDNMNNLTNDSQLEEESEPSSYFDYDKEENNQILQNQNSNLELTNNNDLKNDNTLKSNILDINNDESKNPNNDDKIIEKSKINNNKKNKEDEKKEEEINNINLKITIKEKNTNESNSNENNNNKEEKNAKESTNNSSLNFSKFEQNSKMVDCRSIEDLSLTIDNKKENNKIKEKIDNSNDFLPNTKEISAINLTNNSSIHSENNINEDSINKELKKEIYNKRLEKIIKEKNDFINLLEKSYPGLSKLSYAEVYSNVLSECLSELTTFEIMNLIHKEISIQKTLKRNNQNIEIFDFPVETIDIIDPLFINQDHLSILKNYKIYDLKDKNKIYGTENLTDDFFYTTKEKRRKLIKYADGCYNYIPIKCYDKKCTDENCRYSHNKYELNYHYLSYKIKYSNNDDYTNSNIALCPFAKNYEKDFRIIYNYKDKNIIDLLKYIEEDKDLSKKETKNILKKYFGEIKEFNLNSFKLFKCKKTKCKKDSHLCFNYHCEYEKRRHPLLYRYSNKMCPDQKYDKDENIIKQCQNEKFCNKCHTRYEYYYHQLNFNKIVDCTRKTENGKCIFIETCYGYHDPNRVKTEEELINERKEKLNKELNQLKEKIEDYKCQNCKKYPKNFKFFVFKCKHFFCRNCYIKSKDYFKCPKCKQNYNEDNVHEVYFKKNEEK